MENNTPFSFNISLSVLNHLGRNLYRNFITVLGEAISNAWDADAENIWIVIDKDNNSFVIKDDGIGMSRDDFQDKFLRIGYSKRENGISKSAKDRPYIGRKGIGKLALLSCARKITVVSKIKEENYVGGVIDNEGLDKAITDDANPQDYELGKVNEHILTPFKENHPHGTIIYFEEFNDGIRNNLPHLNKMIALYFRFSLIDSKFNIHLNGEKITVDCLGELTEKTEFSWTINSFEDPYITKLTKLEEKTIELGTGAKLPIKGFIASTTKPSDLNIFGTGEKAGVDIFVNGRLRERNILRHRPGFATRHIASYLYGQIHFDELDNGGKDRCTSNREGFIAGDDKYEGFLEDFKTEVLRPVSEKWDVLRNKRKRPSDPENNTEKQRAIDLFNVIVKEYHVVNDDLINSLENDAAFNFASYANCFISENLLRKYIRANNIDIPQRQRKKIENHKEKEEKRKKQCNVSIDIRCENNNENYLSMHDLASVVVIKDDKNGLKRDAQEYSPIRNAMAHTALLTQEAKDKLKTVSDNIRANLKTLLSGNEDSKK